MKIKACVWLPCPDCQAPKGANLPPGGSYTVEQAKSGIDKVTTHYVGCPRGFRKIVIPDVE